MPPTKEKMGRLYHMLLLHRLSEVSSLSTCKEARACECPPYRSHAVLAWR